MATIGILVETEEEAILSFQNDMDLILQGAVPAAALIGIPLYMRVTALLPLVGPFAAKGVSMGAIIALVIGSGGASLPEVILLKRLFCWPLIVAFLVVIFSTAVIGGLIFNQFLA